MKNFVFSDNFHQIIYIIPAPSTPAPFSPHPHTHPTIPLSPVHPPTEATIDYFSFLFFFSFFLHVLLHPLSRIMSRCTLYTPVLQDESLQLIM